MTIKKVFELNSEIKSIEELENGDLRIVGYASTGAVDRVGDVILPKAWEGGGLDNFTKNPILLFNHNYDKPIGRVEEMETDTKGLKVVGYISKAAPEHALIKEKILRTFSVGFMPDELEYSEDTDGFIISKAELYEISVVSVPCNQDATFSIAKSFDNKKELKSFLDEKGVKIGKTEDEVKATEPVEPKSGEPLMRKKMDEEEKKAIEEAAAKAAVAAYEKKLADDAEKAAIEAAAAEKAVKKAAEAKANTDKIEELMSAFDERVKTNSEDVAKTMAEFQEAMESNKEEMEKFNTAASKRQFSERSGNSDWKKEHKKDIEDAWLMARVTGKAGELNYNTDVAKNVLEKVNTQAGVEVSSADFEQIVSTSVYEDIELQLVLKPLFEEIQMTSATMILPILPDAGYAEITTAQTASGTNPKGNLDDRAATYGDNAGIDLTEKTISTVKFITRTYLGNETEEDAILPILPLIRKSMIRTHARGMEQFFLNSNLTGSVYAAQTKKGLTALAEVGTKYDVWGSVGTEDPMTAAALFTARKGLGKYGLRPMDVVYIVSLEAYYELIEDAEFQNVNEVGNLSTKLAGEVGNLYGSRVIVCDEFGTPGFDDYEALVVNTSNYVVPRLRGMTIESDYETAEQRNVLVASQRLGFEELITGATALRGIKNNSAS